MAVKSKQVHTEKKLKLVSKQVLGTFWLYIGISGSNSNVKMNNHLPISIKGQNLGLKVGQLLVDNQSKKMCFFG